MPTHCPSSAPPLIPPYPHLLQVVTPKALVAGAQGLEGMLQEVLRFLPTHCHLLTEVVAGDLGEGLQTRPLEGYDFVVRSVWPEVAAALEKRVPAVFAAGNPETFYKVGWARGLQHGTMPPEPLWCGVDC